MEDYTEEPEQSGSDVDKRIHKVQRKLKGAQDSLGKKEAVDELTKLEQERLRSGNYFEASDSEAEQEPVDATAFPRLYRLWKRYSRLVQDTGANVRDVQALALYLQHFDDEFLGLFNERRLKLDVKYSLERDTFYNLFSQLTRKLESYRNEDDRIQAGEYTRQYEEDILKRLVEMRHALFVEADRFFRQLNRFAADLLDDLGGDAVLCQNGDDVLEYSDLDREKDLRGLSVEQALEQLYELSDEAIAYLDIPDFGR
jgi:hypothetical protein